MFNVLFSPLDAIAEAARKRSNGMAFLLAFVTSLLFGIDYLIKHDFHTSSIRPAIELIIIYLFITLLTAFLLKFFLYLLTEKGHYYDSFVSINMGGFVLSVGLVVSSLIALIPSKGLMFSLNLLNGFKLSPVVIVSQIILLLTFVLSNAVTLRSLTYMLNVDLFTVIVAMLIIYAAITIALSFILIQSVLFGLHNFTGVFNPTRLLTMG